MTEDLEKWEEGLLNELQNTVGRHIEEIGLTRCHVAGVLHAVLFDVLNPAVEFIEEEDEDDGEFL